MFSVKAVSLLPCIEPNKKILVPMHKETVLPLLMSGKLIMRSPLRMEKLDSSLQRLKVTTRNISDFVTIVVLQSVGKCDRFVSTAVNLTWTILAR
ncbi:hypothetical protein TNCV_2170021 [Trichonephila clavipes]|nr:hypothetical protein TNCV_2170021 [Trichonephila clavipes]